MCSPSSIRGKIFQSPKIQEWKGHYLLVKRKNSTTFIDPIYEDTTKYLRIGIFGILHFDQVFQFPESEHFSNAVSEMLIKLLIPHLTSFNLGKNRIFSIEHNAGFLPFSTGWYIRLFYRQNNKWKEMWKKKNKDVNLEWIRAIGEEGKWKCTFYSSYSIFAIEP